MGWTMNLIALPAYADNYIWMLHHQGRALVVDPGDAKPVLDALASKGWVLERILVTHHHADHVGGVEALRAATAAQVNGPAGEKMPHGVMPMTQGQSVSWQGVDFHVMDVPGHTAGHIAYFGHPPGMAPVLFCGDTLFSGGCGRLFEGTPAQMLHSLDQLAALPGTTQVCCAHEYTLSNLKFARHIEPNNSDLQSYEIHCQDLRAQGLPTLPSNMALEMKINPFLRSRQASVRASLQQRTPTPMDDASCFAALRQWKNDYR
jgi:hydroxyacylglutathione hydrolase